MATFSTPRHLRSNSSTLNTKDASATDKTPTVAAECEQTETSGYLKLETKTLQLNPQATARDLRSVTNRKGSPPPTPLPLASLWCAPPSPRSATLDMSVECAPLSEIGSESEDDNRLSLTLAFSCPHSTPPQPVVTAEEIQAEINRRLFATAASGQEVPRLYLFAQQLPTLDCYMGNGVHGERYHMSYVSDGEDDLDLDPLGLCGWVSVRVPLRVEKELEWDVKVYEEMIEMKWRSERREETQMQRQHQEWREGGYDIT